MLDLCNYSSDAIEAVSKSRFLSEDDFSAVREMAKELQDTWNKQQMWRTETEMRVSVLNDLKHPTADSKYWQSVREQAVFFEQLVLLSFQYQRNEIKIERLRSEINNSKDRLNRKEKEIDLSEALYGKKNMELSARNRVRELRLWSKIKKELLPKVKDAKEVDTHQLVSYGKRFIYEVLNLDIDKATPGEARNIVGQFQAIMKRAEEQRLVDEIVKGIDHPRLQEILDLAKVKIQDF